MEHILLIFSAIWSSGWENEQLTHDGLIVTMEQILKVCKTISIITKMSITISTFSQPFGFRHALIGYQIKAISVLYNFYYQHFKVELQI